MLKIGCHILAAAASLPMLVGGAVRADTSSVDELFELSRSSNEALMRGDIDRYNALIELSGDFVLMSPFGAQPTHAKDITPETLARMGRFFKDGDLRLELVQGLTSPEMVVLALIERSAVAVGSLPKQEWALRVTLVYRRDGAKWKLAHRHADPLVGGVSLLEAAELARRAEPRP